METKDKKYSIPFCAWDLVHAASTDATRFNLRGVYFDGENKRAVATDGWQMVMIDLKDFKPEEGTEMPWGLILSPLQKQKPIVRDCPVEAYVSDGYRLKGTMNPLNVVEIIDGDFPDYVQAKSSRSKPSDIFTIRFTPDEDYEGNQPMSATTIEIFKDYKRTAVVMPVRAEKRISKAA